MKTKRATCPKCEEHCWHTAKHEARSRDTDTGQFTYGYVFQCSQCMQNSLIIWDNHSPFDIVVR